MTPQSRLRAINEAILGEAAKLPLNLPNYRHADFQSAGFCQTGLIFQ
jgi:hypothetical protein